MGLVAVAGATMLAGAPVRAFGKTPLLQRLGQLETDRVLVLIQLSGGNDGLNTVVPITNDGYYNARPQIAIPASETAAIEGVTDLAFHPSFDVLTPMYGEGEMAVLQNVGYPDPVLSHFDATDIWLTASNSGELSRAVWIGSYLDVEYPEFETTSSEFPLAVQMGGTSPMLFQGPVSNMGMSLASPELFNRIAEEGILYTLDDLPSTTFGQEMEFMRTIANDSFVYAEAIQMASESGRNEVEYPQGNRLAENLAIVARLIKGQLGTRIYHVSIGSFDTHANQGTVNGQHANLLRNLAEAVTSFLEDIGAGGRSDDVLVATFSEFGRRVTQNGSGGTDHGTAAPMFVFGPGANGGVYGGVPDLDNLDETGNLQFELDFRAVYATLLADWFGLSPETVEEVLGESFATLGFVSDPATPTSTESGDASTDDGTTVPGSFSLDQNYPNPFSSTTTIAYTLEGPGRVKIRIYDSGGRLVETLLDEQQSAGRHVATLDARDLAGGRYLFHLETEFGTRTLQMVLVR